jgi:glucan phosphoethanolaminetransferase (alkaline phosphatase superfamily)
MGYKTFYFDGQLSYRWIGKPSDVEYVDEWLMADSLKKGDWYDVDAEIAGKVREIVGSSTGNFIWINKFGVHFPYKNSYPDAAAKWLPVPESGDKLALFQNGDEQEKLNNSYDNAILYNSQSFFKGIFENGLAADTFYIYTSDHGQNLSESGRANSHCLSTKNEANVPLFIAAQPEILPEADTAYKAAHANIFPTLLDLMNFPESERQKNYSPSLLKTRRTDSKPRFYFSGNLHSKISAGRFSFDE